MEDIDALALLKEELETEEVHLKVNAIHRLKTVIMCIGVDDTIKKLIPYLESKNQSRLNHVQVSLRRKMMKFCSLSRKSSARFGKNL
jgi:histidyl-tRNA synthetase